MMRHWGLLGALGLCLYACPVNALEPRTVQGELTTSDQKDEGRFFDLYEFSGQAGEEVAIEASSQDFNTFVVLLDSTFQPLAGDDNGAGGTNSLLVFELPKTGQYQVVIVSVFPNQTGNYELSWRSVTPVDDAHR